MTNADKEEILKHLVSGAVGAFLAVIVLVDRIGPQPEIEKVTETVTVYCFGDPDRLDWCEYLSVLKEKFMNVDTKGKFYE